MPARSGPRPAPTAVRILQGQKPYRINKQEPQPTDKPFAPPSWLSKYALEEWQRLEPELIAMNATKAVDSTALSAYCEAVSRFREATQEIKLLGMISYDAKTGEAIRNPAVIIARDASAEMLRWSREFGFTPSSRQSLKTNPAAGAPTTMQQLLASG